MRVVIVGEARGRAASAATAAALGRRGLGEAAAGEDDGDVYLCAVELGFVHFGDGALGRVDFGVEDVGGAAVDVDCARGIRGWDWREGGRESGSGVTYRLGSWACAGP